MQISSARFPVTDSTGFVRVLRLMVSPLLAEHLIFVLDGVGRNVYYLPYTKSSYL